MKKCSQLFSNYSCYPFLSGALHIHYVESERNVQANYCRPDHDGSCSSLTRLLLIYTSIGTQRGEPGSPNNLRGGEGGGGGGGGGGATYPLEYSTHLFLQFLCKTGKNHKCTKLKGKIIINVTLI